MSGLRVAVIGSGPAGVYAAAALTRAGERRGRRARPAARAVRAGALRRRPGPREDEVGATSRCAGSSRTRRSASSATSRSAPTSPAPSWRRYYDAVVFATGAAVDRRLGVPGEDLPGSFSATDFVAWYSGHPDAELDRFTLQAAHAVVIGVGNVAVDVARVLTKTADELAAHRRARARARRARRQRGHRGHHARPARPGARPVHHQGAARAGRDRRRRHRRRPGRPRAVRARSRPRSPPTGRCGPTSRCCATGPTREPAGPAARGCGCGSGCARPRCSASAAVSGLPGRADQAGRTGGLVGTGETVDFPAELVLRSVGYRVVPPRRAAVRPGHRHGPARRPAGCWPTACRCPAMYVAGWLKRGPTGIIGTNKPDATETVASLLADADGLPRAPERDPDAIVELLLERKVRTVGWSGWEAIDAAERALGVGPGLRPGQDRRPGDAAADRAGRRVRLAGRAAGRSSSMMNGPWLPDVR